MDFTHSCLPPQGKAGLACASREPPKQIMIFKAPLGASPSGLVTALSFTPNPALPIHKSTSPHRQAAVWAITCLFYEVFMCKKLIAALVCGLFFSVAPFNAANASSDDFVRRAVVNEAKREAKNEVKDKVSETVPSLVKPSITARQARKLAVKYGHTGYRALPPSIADNLGRNKPLPPGAGKAVPADLLAELPEYENYQWKVAGKDLVLVWEGSGNPIAEVLRKVFK